MSSQTSIKLNQPRIVEGEAMKMLGINRRYGIVDKSGIMAQWGEFSPHIHAIPNQTSHA